MKTLILMFASCIFEDAEVKNLESNEAYNLAKDGVSNATCDIYTSEDFFSVWNSTPNDLDGWIAKPIYVDDATYNMWWK